MSEIAAFDPYYAEKFRLNAMMPYWHQLGFQAKNVRQAFEHAVDEWVQTLYTSADVDFKAFLGNAKKSFARKHNNQYAVPSRNPATADAKIAKHEDKDIQQPPAEKTEQTAQKPKLKRPEAFMPHIYVKFKECPRTTYYPSLKALYTSIMGEAHIDLRKPCPLHFQHDRSNIQAHDLTYRQRIDWLKKQVCKLVTEHMPNRTVEHIERITQYGDKYIA